MAATFDRLSNGRVLLNLVTGGDEAELRGDGLYEDHSTRYQTANEYVKIWREILTRSHTGEAFTFHGERLQVDDAKLLYPPVQNLTHLFGLAVPQMSRSTLRLSKWTLTSLGVNRQRP